MFGAMALPKCVRVGRVKCKFTRGLSSGALTDLKRLTVAQMRIQNQLPLERWSPDMSQMCNCRTTPNEKSLVARVLELRHCSSVQLPHESKFKTTCRFSSGALAPLEHATVARRLLVARALEPWMLHMRRLHR